MKRSILLVLTAFVFQFTQAQTNTFPSNGNVGIGTSAPAYKLHTVSQGNTGTASSYLSGQYYGTAINSESTSSSYYAFNVISGANSSGVGGSSRFLVRADGNVGIGNAYPKVLLDVGGETRIGRISDFPVEGSIGEGDWGNYIIGDVNNLQRLRLGVSNDMYTRAEIFLDNSNRQDGTISFKTVNGGGGAITRMFIDGNGTVGIGTINLNTDYKLFVEKGIRTRKIKVDQANWPDYVFHVDYKLPLLKDLETYIKQNSHLPDMPSSNEVGKNGLDLGDNQALLLKKIEELTLYIIEQDKEIKDLKEQNKELQDIKKELEIIKTKLQS